ncbi:MAG: hypothetical protein NUV55_05915 [Sulfuricaulis sp.]|uniref:hypothetical protein n=1 Tax=Sulfuricaulis sp. TaxID=2003553 RepID=UPI0025E6E58D|nr:hypothetical protein [Sulfuricaulis sp.]MCR4346720.1 hypothetical protein [Sulfuricaulis sp.]
MAEWYFDTYRPQDKRRDPIQGEFFSSETISDPGRALVREGIQNSLDAAIGDEPVLVRIFVSGKENAKKSKDVSEFLTDGWEHFRAPDNGLREVPDGSELCEFLVFEDFFTKGLTGDISKVPYGKNQKNAFAHFFRGDGISDKGEGDRGSWGVGKTVFQRSSRINTMFGFTVRHDDKKALLMGMAVLKGHQLNNKDYKPDGWYGLQRADEMVMPIDDAATLERFRKCFSLDRGSESGLSIVVPWLDPEVTEGAIVEAVLRDYFYPTLTGRLEVIIKTPSTEITVSKDSLHEEIQRIGGDLERDLWPLINLARWSLGEGTATIPKLKSPDLNKAMDWDEKLIPEELRPHLTNQLMTNKQLAIRVPVNVREKSKPAQPSYFDVFIIRDGSDRNERPVFVRGGLIIPDVRPRPNRGLTALVIVEDRPLATFLGDSENPSHTQWQHDGSHFKGKYKSGPKDLKFVSDSVRNIVRLLTETESEEDRDILSDIFNLPDGELQDKKAGKNKGGSENEENGGHKNGKRIFNISRVDGGFIIAAAGTVEAAEIPKSLEIQAAYEVRRGNAFTRYIPEDFDFKDDEFDVELHSATLLSRANNRISAKLDDKDFQVTVRGFDVNRDVRVRVTAGED